MIRTRLSAVLLRRRLTLGFFAVALGLPGCDSLPTLPSSTAESTDVAQSTPPPPYPPPPYQVQYGDTLSTIASKLGVDYLALAEINNLTPPYAIYEGQVLTIDIDGLTSEQRAAVEEARRAMMSRAGEEGPDAVNPFDAPDSSDTADTSDILAVTESGIDSAAAESDQMLSLLSTDGLWQWPAAGAVVAEFSAANHKGIDIAGERGAPVFAAADGVVQHVYESAPQYGRLLIINHGDQYLGFYGHNERILVEVGATIARGQSIAEMGDSGTDSVKLHFELRKNAMPIDPRAALPEI